MATIKSIKEKAKAYDEAIEKFDVILNLNTVKESGTIFADDVRKILPELAESEGDRINKAIYNCVKWFGFDSSFFKDVSQEECLAWLEKQCEQKIKTPEESLGIDSDTYNKIVDECIYGEQKPTDNVEPKFHEGEWIIHQGTENIYQVVARIDNQYQLKYGDNYTIQKCADVDRCARLWDITKDAKDGDMLAWDDSKCIALFKNIYDEDSFNSYGFVGGCTGTFESRQSYHDIEGAHPATKEQRDLLFQKMHEAGYEWDAEKKELIKIEQKPAWSEKDNEHVNSLLKRLDGLCRIEFTTTRFAINEDENWLKSLKDKYTWKPSEEQMNNQRKTIIKKQIK